MKKFLIIHYLKSEVTLFQNWKKNFFFLEEILFDYSNHRYPVERNQIKLKKEKKYGVHILIYTFIQKFIQQQKCFTFTMKETRRNKKKIALFFYYCHVSVFLFLLDFNLYTGGKDKNKLKIQLDK